MKDIPQAPWHLVEGNNSAAIHADYHGRPAGCSVSIGSTSLVFKRGRYGARRGQEVTYREWSRADRALLAVIQSAPAMLETLLLIQRGIASGAIKSKPIITGMDDPEATEYGMKSLAEIVNETLKPLLKPEGAE